MVIDRFTLFGSGHFLLFTYARVINKSLALSFKCCVTSFPSQIASFSLLLAATHAQTTSSPHQFQRSQEVKSKRGLYEIGDGLIGPPPPPPFQNNPYATQSPRTILSPAKWTNVFGFDDITYQHLYNELNGLNYGGLPTHITPPPPNALPSVYNNGYNNNGFNTNNFNNNRFNNNGYGYVNYGSPLDFDSTYVSHDGRVVKQYSVHEKHHNDHPDPNAFRASPRVPTPTTPVSYPPYFDPSNINYAQPRTLFAQNPRVPQNPNQIPSFLTKNHGPVALGSGGLGFVQLPNGDVFLGSGSLGYISHKDHYDNVIEIANRRQKSHPRGPTSFGHPHL